jgi:hypothetical protein
MKLKVAGGALSDETMLQGSSHYCDSVRTERRLRGSSPVARTDGTVEESGWQ